MDSDEAVTAFARAGQPNGVLSGVYAFQLEQACKMIRPGNRVLDLGCGPASLLTSIGVMNQESSFVGIDLSEEMITKAHELVDSRSACNVDLRIGDMTKLSSIESGSIDVVLSSMALHHLSNTEELRKCFAEIDRVMAPKAKAFISDFGRVKSLRSVDYFVSRAIPKDEPVLERDYRASLRAAFSRAEFIAAMPPRLKQRLGIYSTVVSPVMIVLMTSFPESSGTRRNVDQFIDRLPRKRRADLWQLRLFLRLGGMPSK